MPLALAVHSAVDCHLQLFLLISNGRRSRNVCRMHCGIGYEDPIRQEGTRVVKRVHCHVSAWHTSKTTPSAAAASCTLSCHCAQIILLSHASQLTTAIGIAHGSQDQLLIYIWFACEIQSSHSLWTRREHDARKRCIAISWASILIMKITLLIVLHHYQHWSVRRCCYTHISSSQLWRTWNHFIWRNILVASIRTSIFI